MDAAEFEEILEDQLTVIGGVLSSKAKEYAAGSDHLHNFKQAAALQGITPIEALGGMMAKHTVSIYDMLGSDAEFPLTQWDEKITDHLNYLILLRALVIEKLKKGTNA